MKTTLISVEVYPRNEISFCLRRDDLFNEHVECIAKLHKHKHLNVMETKRKDLIPNIYTKQPPIHNNQITGKNKQIGKKIKDTWEYNKHKTKKLLPRKQTEKRKLERLC